MVKWTNNFLNCHTCKPCFNRKPEEQCSMAIYILYLSLCLTKTMIAFRLWHSGNFWLLNFTIIKSHYHINIVVATTTTTFFTKLKDVMFDSLHYIFLSAIDSLTILYNTLIRSKLEYTPVAYNSITLTDSSKLERILRKSAALCYIKLLTSSCDNRDDDILVRLNLSTLQPRG
jgi:hypothetical protein